MGLFINPFYFARKGLALQIGQLARSLHGRILDIGCGSKPYQRLFSVSEYIGLELDTPENRAKKKADFYYDGGPFPFNDGVFDCAITFQTLEHVFTPDEFLREIDRVLKPGGNFLVTVPFIWDEHEQPADYARYSSFGIRSLLERNGFAVMDQRKTMDDIRAIFQVINAYFFKVTVTRSPLLNLLSSVTLMAPFNILGSILGHLTPRNPDLYLDNIVLARKQDTK